MGKRSLVARVSKKYASLFGVDGRTTTAVAGGQIRADLAKAGIDVDQNTAENLFHGALAVSVLGGIPAFGAVATAPLLRERRGNPYRNATKRLVQIKLYPRTDKGLLKKRENWTPAEYAGIRRGLIKRYGNVKDIPGYIMTWLYPPMKKQKRA